MLADQLFCMFFTFDLSAILVGFISDRNKAMVQGLFIIYGTGGC